MKLFYLRLAALLVFTSITMSSADSHANEDPRLRIVPYDSNRVVRVHVRPHFAVHIVLSPSEQIVAAGTGLSSHCDDPMAGWCVVAKKGTSDIYINAHESAEQTNLFVKTTRRNYSFDLQKLAWARSRVTKENYRVVFTYPEEQRFELEKETVAKEKIARELEKQRKLMTPLAKVSAPLNWNYTKQALPGSDEIVPTKMYDDGRFTYITFNSREFPAVYKVSDNDRESLIQSHVEDGNVMVVHQVAKRFILRAGDSVVGLWNETYDSRSTPLTNGVTVPGVVRRLLMDSAESPGSGLQQSPLPSREPESISPVVSVDAESQQTEELK
ncbi:TrbG/VirB9 family P-type conjugative transfer protein [Cupriavidus necator]